VDSPSQQPKLIEEFDAPGTAKDWEDFSRSVIGRWLRKWVQDSLAQGNKQLVFGDPTQRDRYAGGCEVLYSLLDMLDTIPQDKVQSEQGTATETDPDMELDYE